METERKHIIKLVWVNACRFLLAALFIFSGFVKAVDPLGSFYKIQDYLTAFGMISWFPTYLPLLFAIILSSAEFCVGVFLFFGVRRKVASTLALFLMGVMTPLTLYLALANPVSDCGCFGDAWVLTNWQTFGKNIILLIAAVTVFKERKLIIRFITLKMEWMVSLYTILFVFALSFYCLEYLPVLDFRPYKIGVNIKAGMEIPEGAKPSVFESRFVLEKDGRQQEFTLDNYPDSTWTFVETRTVLKEKGYEPPIHDFSMISLSTGEDITDSVLTDKGYTFLLVAHRTEEADDSNIDLINEIYDYSIEHGYGFYALTSSPDEEIEAWRDRTGAEYPFCQMDDITLKTIIRSNPGLLLIKDGTILNKWSDSQFPDEYVLNDSLDKLDGKGWNMLFLENHDHPRIISRYGNSNYREASGKMLAAMYLFQKGTPFVYQGQEIGMVNWHPENADMYEDVATRYYYSHHNLKASPRARLHKLWRCSRDSARTLMQWSDGPNAGFTTGEPWFYANDNYKQINVARQDGDRDSVLNFYRLAIGLRKRLSCVRWGKYREFSKGSKWLYQYSMQDDRQKILVICSFSDKNRKYKAPDGFYLDRGKLILCNYPNGEPDVLRPYETRVYLW